MEDIEVTSYGTIRLRFTEVDHNEVVDASGDAGDTRDKNFMNAPNPVEQTLIANAAFTPKFAGGIPELVAADNVFPIEGLDVARSSFDRLTDAVGVENDVVGINPKDPIAGGAIEGLLASMRKVPAPSCVEYPVCILTSDFLGGGRSINNKN